MARPRKAAEKLYAWSNLHIGGESTETRLGRKIVSKNNIVTAGSEFDASEYDVTEEEVQEWKDLGVLRTYPHPEGYEGDVTLGMSPYTFVVEQAKAEIEAAEDDAAAESVEDRLLRASVVGTQTFGPTPEEVLLVGTPEGVEEPEAES